MSWKLSWRELYEAKIKVDVCETLVLRNSREDIREEGNFDQSLAMEACQTYDEDKIGKIRTCKRWGMHEGDMDTEYEKFKSHRERGRIMAEEREEEEQL
eukprot:748730-Hanusia_phi.AAC.3